MRRFLSIWLPYWPTDRWQRRNDADLTTVPFALVLAEAGHLRLISVNACGLAIGLQTSMSLADARALAPTMIVKSADPKADAAALLQLADWCGCFAPWTAADPPDGIVLDITGTAHLFGGEHRMLAHVETKLAALGLESRLAIADTPSAAWATARFDSGRILRTGTALQELADLPVAALRLDERMINTLKALGLYRIGALAKLPRGPLARRFGPILLERLDGLLGRREAPISPRREPARWRSRADLAEPIITRQSIEIVLKELLRGLCQILEEEELGARQVSLYAFKVDGALQNISIGTARPSRDPDHLFRLFREKLDHLEPGFGIETFLLEAPAADRLTPEQAKLYTLTRSTDAGFAQLIDRLQTRLGVKAVFQSYPVDSHCPERAVISLPAMTDCKIAAAPPHGRRPSLLLHPPEYAEMQSEGRAFHWRGLNRRIIQATGPERLRSEWWQDGMDVTARDYYRIEDDRGHRYWLFKSREGWFVHGLFL